MSKYQTPSKRPTGRFNQISKPGRYFIVKVIEGQPTGKYLGTQSRAGTVVQSNSTEKHLDVKNSQGLAVQEAGEVARARTNSTGKVLGARVPNKRTGPKGKKAMISDGAVDSIAENMEKRTRSAIAKIGRSIGF